MPREVLSKLSLHDHTLVMDIASPAAAATKSMGNTRRDEYLNRLTTRSWDLWKYNNVCLTAEIVTKVLKAVILGKTCGRDDLG